MKTPIAGAARPLRIGVIGASRCSRATARLAERVGAAIAAAGAVLVCGGLGGVMEAAARGTNRAGGMVVGLLPGADASAANAWVDLPLPTGLGYARNVLVVTASEAIVALPGAAGTRSEMAFADVLGRPVIGLRIGATRGDVTVVVDDPEEAVRRALRAAVRRRSGSGR